MVKRRPGRVSRKEFAAACRFDGAAVTLMTSDVLPDAVYPPTNAVTGAAEQLRLSVRSFGACTLRPPTMAETAALPALISAARR